MSQYDANQRFARLLAGAVNAIAAFENKTTRVVAAELGEAIGRTFAAIEHYKSAKARPHDPEHIRILATLCVRRAHLDATWLQRFLLAARYTGDTQALIAELCPTTATQPQGHVPSFAPPPWYDNLAGPPYSQFIMRREPLAALLAGLHGRKPVVLHGIGGMGKSSLAYEIASRCKAQRLGLPTHAARLPGALPAVHAVVWVSDQEQPGTTTLERVLDTIAETLDHRGLTGYDLLHKQHEVEQLLGRSPALLIVDNVDTITDRTLLPWLLQLPEPSKVVLTTRTRQRLFEHASAYIVALGGMTEGEANQLLDECARRLSLPFLIDAAERRELLELTGRSPLALRQLLGYLNRTGQSIRDAQASFARLEADLLPNLFARSWQLLDPPARALLHILVMLPGDITRETLLQVFGYTETMLAAIIGQLTDLALLERVVQDGQPGRWKLHPLTRHFVAEQQVDDEAMLGEARNRWLRWASDYAATFGYAINDIGRLKLLDADEALLFAALGHASADKRDAEVVRLVHGLEFYYYTRALWNKKLVLHAHYIAAARRLNDVAELIMALTMHSQLLCRLGRLDEATGVLAELTTLAERAAVVGEPAFHVAHAQGLYQLARKDYGAAQEAWQHILAHADAWQLPQHMVIGARHWLAISFMRQGQNHMARALFERSLEAARASDSNRWIARNQLQLASLDVVERRFNEADQRLEDSRARTDEADREQLAHLERVQARLYHAHGVTLKDAHGAPLKDAHGATLKDMRGATFEAQKAYQTARDLFARMGLAHELTADDEAQLLSRRWDDE